MAREVKAPGILAALRIRPFAVFTLACLVSNVGLWMSNLTVPVILFQLTGSAVWVGVFAVAVFAPGIILAPISGLIADRFDRRRVLLVTQLGMTLAAFALWLMWSAGVHIPGVLLIPVVVNGIFGAMNMPSFLAFVHDLVPRENLRAAVTINSIQFNLARAVGPLVAGLLLATTGPDWALLVNALSFLGVVTVLVVIRARETQVLVRTREPIMLQFAEAARYMASKPGIRLAIIGGIVGAVLGQPLYSMSVVLADQVYRVGSFDLGMLNMCLSIGAVAAIPLLAGRWGRLPLSRAVAGGMVGTAIALVALSATTSYVFAVPLFMFAGGAAVLIMAGTATVIQLIVRDDLRGRILAIRQMTFTAGMPLGAMLAGVVADVWGIRLFLLGAGIIVACAALVMRFVPRRGFSSMDDPHDTFPTSSRATKARA